MRADSDIERDVEDELRWDPDLDATDIAVNVRDRIANLAGFTRSYNEKIEAEAAVKRVAGIVGAANDIEVHLPNIDERPDPDIARDAVAALRGRMPTVSDQIRTTVADGLVKLEGEVEWEFQRKRAECAVRYIRGVKGVINLITLKPQVEPWAIQRGIEEAFRRNAGIDANRIQVETPGGEVILRATVRSSGERQEAARIAWAAPGTVEVENRIVIHP